MIKHHITLIAFLLLVAGCQNGGNGNETDDILDKAVPVFVEELETQTFRHYLKVQGNVDSDRTIAIMPKSGGTVKEIHAKAGDIVKEGQVLAVLDGEIVKKQVKAIDTQLELAEDMYQRQSKLREDDIGSEVEYLQIKNQVESLRDQKATLQEQYDNFVIKATIDGTIDRATLKLGETVGPERLAFQIVNSDALKIIAELSERYINTLQESNQVEITFPSLDTKINTNIDVISRVINPGNRTFTIEIHIPNENGNIRPNMTSTLRINDYTAENQIVIPANALQISNGDRFVYVAEQDGDYWIAKRRDVQIGMNAGNDLIINEGLKAGDLLITTGYNSISDNDYIVIK